MSKNFNKSITISSKEFNKIYNEINSNNNKIIIFKSKVANKNDIELINKVVNKK